MSDVTRTATELNEAYRQGSLSPSEVTRTILERAKKLNGTLNAFRLLDPDTALEAASASDDRWRAGTPIGPLDGIPISIKDIVEVKGHACLCGSLTSDPEKIAAEDCPSVARLREAGAVLFGLTHTPEYGWKGITDTPMHGITRNPWNTDHTPGGSSGGASAAVAAGIGPLALGTDGGGSVRIPSSYAGLFGIKPTFGRVPHYPNESPYATLVSNGPLARTVKDAALMLNELAKPDARDWYAAPDQQIDFTKCLGNGVKGLRIAYSPNLGGAEPTMEVQEKVEMTLQRLERHGAIIEKVDEVFSPLRPIFEEYWKAGFGYILKSIPEKNWEMLDPGFLRLATEGLEVDLETYYKAVSARVSLGSRLGRFFENFDLLVTPTMTAPAPRADIVYHSSEFDRWRDATPYTVPFNLTGLPAASIPVGLSDSGLPIGMQIVGPRFAEEKILQASTTVEQDINFRQTLDAMTEGW